MPEENFPIKIWDGYQTNRPIMSTPKSANALRRDLQALKATKGSQRLPKLLGYLVREAQKYVSKCPPARIFGKLSSWIIQVKKQVVQLMNNQSEHLLYHESCSITCYFPGVASPFRQGMIDGRPFPSPFQIAPRPAPQALSLFGVLSTNPIPCLLVWWCRRDQKSS